MRYYIHIPFCRQRCTYCRFALDPRPTELKIVKYVGHLISEIQQGIQSGPIESIYFGGGTPSVLSVEYLARILSEFPVEQWSPDIEITLECNPEDITLEKAIAYRKLGINRISLGVQTLSEK